MHTGCLFITSLILTVRLPAITPSAAKF